MTHSFEAEIAGRTLTIETGRLAAQAGGAVTIRYGDTMMLGTATASKPRPGIDFFPLSVEFEERLYAAGRIPGSFFRREGRPTTTAILSARLTDRPLRPLFPKGYNDDTQIIITILSVDMENPPDTLGTIAASAALCVSDIPFDGPVASVRIGHVDGELVLQPTFAQLEQSDLNLVVAGTKDAITMVEAEAGEVPESLLVDALALGQEAISTICELQEQMVEAAGREKRPYAADEIDKDALAYATERCGEELAEALTGSGDKAERDRRRAAIEADLLDSLDEDADAGAVKAAFGQLEKQIVRRSIIDDERRPDGRGPADLRPLSADTGLIPRTHGSGLFQRGETQVLSLTTLAGSGMAQRLDDLTPEDSKRFMHHYNFPPFSTGETGRVGNPSRRSIGHGMLGERAMQAILPPMDEFPYTIRVVSEVLASNGSTSMASVCASVLSMMDAGVPIKTPIAGIAMGLIKDDDEVAILTDIAGIEDHLGDMDFKVAGSHEGVTALQMDMKVKGIGLDILERALEQAREARLEIMDVMTECISSPREEMSPHAPRIIRIDVPTDKIGAIIGPGGRSIRQLEEDTGADISVEDDGAVYITAVNQASGQAAYDRIHALTHDPEPGQTFTGKVVRILPFGAFVEIAPGKDAMVHVSELAEGRVERVEDEVNVGDELTVMVTEIDNLGRINASRRAVIAGDDGPPERSERPRTRREPRSRPERGDRPERGEARERRERRPRRERRDDEDGEREPREPRERRPRQRRSRFDEDEDGGVPDSTDDEAGVVERDEDAPEARVADDAPDSEEAPPARDEGGSDMPPRRPPRPRRRREPSANRAVARDDSDDDGAASADGDEAPRRKRRRRRRSVAGESSPPPGNRADPPRQRAPRSEPGEERQPDTHEAPRRRGIFGFGRRREDDGPPGPPPPPRPDLGAPNR